MNRWLRWFVFPAVLLAGLALVLPQAAEAGWGHCHYGWHGSAVPHTSFYGGYYAPYRAYPPVIASPRAFGFTVPYSTYYYGRYPYGASFYHGPRVHWFGTYGW